MKSIFVVGVVATVIVGAWMGCASSAGSTGAGGAGGAGLDVTCNPVTNAGCSDGDACETEADTSGQSLFGFVCYPGPNTVADCGSCDPTGQNPPYCAPGSICFPIDQAGTMGQCAHYCCSDADCGPDGACLVTDTSHNPFFAPVSSTLGVCISAASPDAGAGDGGVARSFVCNAPATSPSNGSCVTTM